VVEQFLARNGLSPDVGLQVDHVDTVKSLVLAGAGVSFLPRGSVAAVKAECGRSFGYCELPDTVGSIVWSRRRV
jgi:DNA-binding transcriptional LysR family regulator